MRYDFDTSLTKFVVIILITNSHLDSLYPDARFATGGSLGNALFFALSGFGLALSSTKHLPNFGSWIGRRLLRIYPQVLVVLLIGGLVTSTLSWWPLESVVRQYWIKGLAGSGLGFPMGALLVWPLIFISAWPVSVVCKRLLGRFARQSMVAQPGISPELARGEQT